MEDTGIMEYSYEQPVNYDLFCDCHFNIKEATHVRIQIKHTPQITCYFW